MAVFVVELVLVGGRWAGVVDKELGGSSEGLVGLYGLCGAMMPELLMGEVICAAPPPPPPTDDERGYSESGITTEIPRFLPILVVVARELLLDRPPLPPPPIQPSPRVV